jgi:hypothetical protein
MGRSCVAGLLVGLISLIGVGQAVSEQTCKAALVLKDVQFSEMRPPTLVRRWTAIVSVDASRCATRVGYFEIGFSRLKETAPELEFREQFIWSAPSVKLAVEFAADEAVEAYWIDKVYPCPCAR